MYFSLLSNIAIAYNCPYMPKQSATKAKHHIHISTGLIRNTDPINRVSKYQRYHPCITTSATQTISERVGYTHTT
jgi:hypothetical protein